MTAYMITRPIEECFGGFTRMHLPERAEIGDRIVLFDQDYEFAQFPVTGRYANEPGHVVCLGPAIPWPRQEEDSHV